MTNITSRGRGFTGASVYLFEQYMPEPLVLAIGLTAVVVGGALAFAPNPALPVILTSWYNGVFAIFGFAFQVIMILVSGHTLAQARPVRGALGRLAAIAKTPNQAAVLTFLIAAAATWLNWGFGMVAGAMLAREVAGRMRVDFAWLVAAAFSGWMLWSVGLSGTIPLAQITHGNALNIVEKVTGQMLPLTSSIFALYTLVPTILYVIVMPIILIAARPAADEIEVFTPEPAPPTDAPVKGPRTFAQRAERSLIASIILIAIGLGYLVTAWRAGTLQLDINAVIFLFVMLGMALHRSPLEYAHSVREAAKQTGSIMLQYPIYGGIMGIMAGTGLAEALSVSVANAATAATLPILSFLASIFISFIIPSGGGHWAVQGPFTIPAAVHLHASIGATTMAVAFGEQVAVMIHPMWAMPMAAIAGIGVQRLMGFTTLAFLVGLTLYGAALLLLV